MRTRSPAGRTALLGVNVHGPDGAPNVADVVPTLLTIMGLPVPEDMTGRVLL